MKDPQHLQGIKDILEVLVAAGGTVQAVVGGMIAGDPWETEVVEGHPPGTAAVDLPSAEHQQRAGVEGLRGNWAVE
jgi:hypothetical protein